MSILAELARPTGPRLRARPTRQSQLQYTWLEPQDAPLDLLDRLAELSHRAVVPPSSRTEIRRRLLTYPALVAGSQSRLVAALYVVPTNRAMTKRDDLMSGASGDGMGQWTAARHLNIVHCEVDPRLMPARLLHGMIEWGMDWLGQRLGRIPRVMAYTPAIGLRTFCTRLCAAPETNLWPALVRLSESGLGLDLATVAARLGNLHEMMNTVAFGTRRQRDALIARDPGMAETFLAELARVYLCEVCRIDDGACLCMPVHWHQQAGARLVRIRPFSWQRHQDALSVVAYLEYQPQRLSPTAEAYARLCAARAQAQG